MNRRCIPLVLAALSVLVVCSPGRKADASEERAKPDFALRDTEGATRRLSQYSGKWVVLEWVNFECPSVLQYYQAPSRRMQALQSAAVARGVVWLSIDSTPPGARGHMTPKQGQAMLARLGAKPTALLLDTTSAVGKTFRATVTPEARVVSPRGDVVYAGGVEHLHTVLNAALAGRALPFARKASKGWAIPYAQPVAARGPKAPDFNLRDNAGVMHRLSDYRGKWVILEWVNYSCPCCMGQYHPSHRSAQTAQARAARMGVVWLTICSSARGKQGQFSPAAVDARLRKMGATPTAYLHDLSGTAGRAYGAKHTPEIRIISPQGTIEFVGGYDKSHRGRKTKEQRARNFVARALDDIAAGRPIAITKTKPYGCSVRY